MVKRYPALDGLRGVAILMVLAYHFVAMRLTTTDPAASSLRALTAFGWAGVDLFFVLSGFLITGLLCEARDRPRYFQTFYARRTLRIFPLYYGYLLVLIVIAPHLTLPAGTLDRWHRAIPFLFTYTSNIAITAAGSPIVTPLHTEATWSLAVEEQFYLVWPLVIALVPARRLRLACLWIAAGAVLYRVAILFWPTHLVAAGMLMPGRADALALGGFLAVTIREGRTAQLTRWARTVQPIAGVVCLLLIALGQDGEELHSGLMATVGVTAVTLLFATVVADAVTPGRSFAGLLGSSRPLRQIGTISYGLYLLHGLVALLQEQAGLDSASLMSRFAFSATPAVLSAAALGITASILAAALSWRYFEGPINGLKRLFPYDQSHRTTVSVPSASAALNLPPPEYRP